MERQPHITFGPGILLLENGEEIRVEASRFDNIVTTPAPGPAGDVRWPLHPDALELHLAFNSRHRRLLAAIVMGWRAKGPVRWVNTMRAMKMARGRGKKRSELL